jgi:hypothetical protein
MPIVGDTKLLAAAVVAVLLAGAAFALPAERAQAPRPAAVQLSPALVRARTEREWSVKAEKMRLHLQPLMRKHQKIGTDGRIAYLSGPQEGLWTVASR